MPPHPAVASLRRPRSEVGQASIELVAALPVVLVIVAVAWQAVLAGQAVWHARVAARAAARAHSFGADAERAARAHLPRALERGLHVTTEDSGDVRVSIRVPSVLPSSRPRSRRCHLPLPPADVMASPALRAVARERGQASIEILGLLPLIAFLALVGLTLVASYTAHEQAGEAAGAGALALLQGGVDARTAAREALPKSVRPRATITITGRRVHVRVLPRTPLPVPGLPGRLAGTAHADAGPSAP